MSARFRCLPLFAPVEVRQGTISLEVPSKWAGKVRRMNARYFVLTALLVVLALTACTRQKETPEELRQQTAQATAEAKSDAKAVAEGVREGWNRDRRLNLNSATKDQLLELPDMSNSEADRIIAARPYGSPDDLLSRHVISKSEYDKISDRIEAK
jgi:DNA uptake protein ComE-like DNA-binding protein